MKNFFFIGAILTGMIPGCATTSTTPLSAEERRDQARAITTQWYPYSEVVAMKLMDEYGPPDQIESDRLVWHNAGPWNKVAVRHSEDYDYSSIVGPDILEQTLFYAVPRDKRKALAAFNDKLAVSKDGKELSVRGNSEALNFLVLNLVNEIVRGDRTPDAARSFYGQIYQLSQAGKSSPYTQGLLFIHQPQPGDTSPQF